MPARSLQAQPDEALKAEIKDLKAKVNALDNANASLSKQLGQAQKDQKALGEAKNDIAGLKAELALAQNEISHLQADLVSVRAKGASDSKVMAAAKQIAEGIKQLS